jgi:hypothetical protein
MFIHHLTATMPRLLLSEMGIEGVAVYVKENMWAYYQLIFTLLMKTTNQWQEDFRHQGMSWPCASIPRTERSRCWYIRSSSVQSETTVRLGILISILVWKLRNRRWLQWPAHVFWWSTSGWKLLQNPIILVNWRQEGSLSPVPPPKMPPFEPLSIDWSGKSNSIFVFVFLAYPVIGPSCRAREEVSNHEKWFHFFQQRLIGITDIAAKNFGSSGPGHAAAPRPWIGPIRESLQCTEVTYLFDII